MTCSKERTELVGTWHRLSNNLLSPAAQVTLVTLKFHFPQWTPSHSLPATYTPPPATSVLQTFRTMAVHGFLAPTQVASQHLCHPVVFDNTHELENTFSLPAHNHNPPQHTFFKDSNHNLLLRRQQRFYVHASHQNHLSLHYIATQKTPTTSRPSRVTARYLP